MALDRDRLQCRISSAVMLGMARCSRFRPDSERGLASSGKVKRFASTPFTLPAAPELRDSAIAAARRGF
jgi:hypothetical protein